jgi:hypothetical protein
MPTLSVRIDEFSFTTVPIDIHFNEQAAIQRDRIHLGA